MTDLHWLTVAEAARLIRARELSPVDYAEALLARTERLNPTLSAYIRVTRERALDDARRAADEVVRGVDRGVLHGIPYGLKDIIDYAGLPTTAHSRILLDNVPAEDAEVTARLRRSGGVLMGKLATHEFAIGGPAFDLPYPPARNPWDTTRFPGGSSSGSGAAVAAGLVPAALGTDTGGSVRNPASMCGIVGMKPTYGRVSRRGVVPLAFSLDTVGPLTRTVEDNALLLNLIAGADPRDPSGIPGVPPDFTADLRRGVRGLRVGVVRHFYTTDMDAHPEVTLAIEDAAQTLADLGAQVDEATLRPLSVYAAGNRTILLSEGYTVHERWLRERPDDYAALTRQRLLPGAFIRAVDYLQATRLRERLVREYAETMTRYDVLITACSMDPPPLIEDAAEIERTYGRQARTVFNLLGCPALSLPIGRTVNGLPLSMQIAGRPLEEATVYRVAHAYEEATAWTSHHPALD